MRLDWNGEIAGVPMLKVRDIVRRVRGISTDYLQDLLGPDVDQASFVDELIARGWIERDGRGFLDTTLAGNAVAQAKKLKPLSRKQADDLLQQVIAAATEMNADERYGHDVSHLAVFGSYLGDAEELGDLDIAYELRVRWTPATADEVRQRCLDAFPPPSSADWMRRLVWPEEVALKKLTVTKRVSLETMKAVQELGFPYRMLMGEPQAG